MTTLKTKHGGQGPYFVPLSLSEVIIHTSHQQGVMQQEWYWYQHSIWGYLWKLPGYSNAYRVFTFFQCSMNLPNSTVENDCLWGCLIINISPLYISYLSVFFWIVFSRLFLLDIYYFYNYKQTYHHFKTTVTPISCLHFPSYNTGLWF
jgi:hypothetical protein